MTQRFLLCVVALTWLAAANPARGQTVSADTMLPIHLEAAKQYDLYADATHQRQFVLREQPVMVWTNPRRAGGQIGHLFLWDDGEVPAALATLFSFPWQLNPTQQRIVHELHSLSESVLDSTNTRATQAWKPVKGIEFIELAGSTEVPENPQRRMLTIRQLTRFVTAHTIDAEQKRWQLRLMPKELTTYNSPDRAGALFSMLGDAGADPELMLLVEAHRIQGIWKWRLAPIRMTDHEIYLSFKDQSIWSSVHDDKNTRMHSADHTYFRFPDAINSIGQ